eukprot:1378584-Rhodomonas_salina.2
MAYRLLKPLTCENGSKGASQATCRHARGALGADMAYCAGYQCACDAMTGAGPAWERTSCGSLENFWSKASDRLCAGTATRCVSSGHGGALTQAHSAWELTWVCRDHEHAAPE